MWLIFLTQLGFLSVLAGETTAFHQDLLPGGNHYYIPDPHVAKCSLLGAPGAVSEMRREVLGSGELLNMVLYSRLFSRHLYFTNFAKAQSIHEN